MVQLSHRYMTTGKTIALTRWIFISKVLSLLLMLSVLVIAFYPRGKYLLISWLQSQSAVILEPKKIKPLTISIFFPIYLPWSDGTGCHDLHFLNVELLSQLFHSPLWSSSRGLFISSLLSAIRAVSSAYLRLQIFILATLIPACDLSTRHLEVTSIYQVT